MQTVLTIHAGVLLFLLILVVWQHHRLDTMERQHKSHEQAYRRVIAWLDELPLAQEVFQPECGTNPTEPDGELPPDDANAWKYGIRPDGSRWS